MMIILYVCAGFLFVALCLVLYRIEKGPSMLDRMVGLDVVTSIIIGSVILIIAATRRTDLVPVLIVLSLVGFIGSTTVSRFLSHESTIDKKVLSKEEVAKLLVTEKPVDDDAEPVHDPDRGDDV